MKHKETCIVLAAGASSRMGTNKMLLPWNYTTVLGQVLNNVIEAGFEPHVVLGNMYKEIEASISGYIDTITIVVNSRWQDGMLSSIQAGLRSVDYGDTFVLHGDMPLVRSGILREIDERFRQPDCDGYEALFPSYKGQSGHPVLLRGAVFEPILALPSAEKLNPFLKTRHWHSVDFSYPEVCLDIDTRKDYLQFQP